MNRVPRSGVRSGTSFGVKNFVAWLAFTVFHVELRLSTEIIAKFYICFTGLIAFVVVCYLWNSFFKSSCKYSALVGHNNLRNWSVRDDSVVSGRNQNNEKMVNGKFAVVSCKNSN